MPLIKKPARSASQDTASQDAAPVADAMAALREGSGDERWRAARSLASHPDAARALGQALGAEADAHVREAILTSLTRIATPASVEAILPYLRGDDANLRTGALDALRAMADVVSPKLPALLADADADVRLLSCEIARARGAAAAPLLCDLLERETEVNVCAAAVEVLAEIGGPRAAPALARCESRFPNEAFLGFAIQVALKRLDAQAGDQRG